MKIADVYDKWLGATLAQDIRELSFQPVNNNPSYITHVAWSDMPILAVKKDLKDRERCILKISKYFDEVLGKLEVLAAETVSGIEIPCDMSVSVLDQVRVYAEKAYGGDPAYVPYLYPEIPTEEEEGSLFGINISVVIVLYKDPQSGPKLTWYIDVIGMKKDPEKPGVIVKDSTIETTRKPPKEE